MACTIEERNSRPCLQAILSFFLPTEKIANKICGCGCTGASIPFLFFLRFRWLMEIAGTGTSCMFKIDYNFFFPGNYLPFPLSFITMNNITYLLQGN
jgi:hypothetical protein